MQQGDAQPAASVSEVRDEILTISQSRHFAQSKRRVRLLEYLCDMVLFGRQDEIKETTIALELFDRTAEFDDKKPVQLDGIVVRFEFMNPHSWIYLDVKNPDGKVVRWAVETGSTNALFRRGWRKDSLRAGDHITVDAFRAKDGSNTANANTVKLPDGRQVSGASSRGGEQ